MWWRFPSLRNNSKYIKNKEEQLLDNETDNHEFISQSRKRINFD
ncbi:hypothetical protein RB653_002263 [Dictyostelium firmibasis]|uniref:Uncharacterized protein n=1 Tax=Dictyostelium firmibasis TaxID=79012 RepID=A0AAN7TNJ0_9MYCE